MTHMLSASDISDLVYDLDTPDWQLASLVELDMDRSGPFTPVLKQRADRADADAAQLLGGMKKWNARTHRKRLRKYRRMLENGYEGPKIVSEGDSWFLYPVLIRETIDHLYDNFAIYSWDAAGDTLEDMLTDNQFIGAIGEEKANFFLISAGGNDILGDIASNLKNFDPAYAAHDYPNDTFDEKLQRLRKQYHEVFTSVTSSFPQVKTFCHGYDYAVPTKRGKWLGRPMREKNGIEDRNLQLDIVRILVNRFNDLLSELATEFGGKVVYVDCRGSVTDERGWFDEIHPRSDGFAEVASRFAGAFRKHN